MPADLLAKSPRDGRKLSLERHCAETADAAKWVFRPDGRWSRSWARLFRFTEIDQRRFLLNLQVSGLFHDIGKANEDFQALVQGKGSGTRQTLRHEHISALILALPEVRSWLAENPDLDVDIITAAVLSHHLKAAERSDQWEWGHVHSVMNAADVRVGLHLGHPEVCAIFTKVQELAKLRHPPALPTAPWTERDGGVWEDALSRGKRSARDFRRAFRRDPSRLPLLLATKAGLIVADSVASGVVRVGGDIQEWVEDVVHRPPLSASELTAAIIDKRIASIEERTKKTFAFHRFQTLAAEQGERALLLAGCGAGKTLAAWKWAEAVLRQRELGRVIFLYPTRGTATEGFRDYVGWAPEADAALVHGSSRYELEAMATNPDESLRGKNYVDEAGARLFALGLWSKRYFSATVDQFLGFLEHSYTGVCLLPVLADSVIILDEIHSYDRRMFDNLKALLSRFDVTVLCMTATLPKQRRADLIELGLRAFPGEEHRDDLKDLEEQECRLRYLIKQVPGVESALARALAAYREGRKVLWVVNTVDRCQEAATALRTFIDDVLIYHSRYRLMDRQRMHEAVVRVFKADKPAIAVTTQVCEMSLDLDADVLITELAPVSSLVQRFGRSNRASTRDPSFRAEVLWYVPRSELPYTSQELTAARSFLAGLGEGPVSQRQLAEGLEHHSIDEPETDDSAAFVTSGYYATPGSLRETDDLSRSSVLDCDIPAVVELNRRKLPYDGFVLPAPKSFVLKNDEALRPSTLPRFLGIVHAHLYDPEIGLRKRQEEEP